MEKSPKSEEAAMKDKEVLVIYKSKYGATERYAKWIAEDLGCEAIPAKEAKLKRIRDYDMLIFGGGLYAGTIGGISKLITRDTAKVTYLVFDSDNNMASCVRRIRYVDYHRPTFEVTEPLVYATTEDVSILSRLKANDVVDGDVSKNIRVSTLESTNHSEIFHITVQVSNSVGDTSVLTLPVLMLESNPLRPEIQLSDSLVYLEQNSDFVPSAYLLGVRAPGVTASVADVTIDNGVDTAKAGTYYVTYTYSANGSTGTAVLTVVVK